MKRVSRSGPPKATQVGFATGTSIDAVEAAVGREAIDPIAFPDGVPDEAFGVDAGAVRARRAPSASRASVRLLAERSPIAGS